MKMNKSFIINKIFHIAFYILLLGNCGYDTGNREAIIPQKEYTAEEPGEWDGLEDSHLPIITTEKIGLDSYKITIKVKESKYFDHKHHVEKIGIFNELKQDLAVKNYNEKEILHGNPFLAQAEFTLDSLPEKKEIKAFIKCNLHDLWTTPVFPPKKNWF